MSKRIFWYIFLLLVLAFIADGLLKSIPSLTVWFLLYIPEGVLFSMFIYILLPALATILMWPRFRVMYSVKNIPEPLEPTFFTLLIPAHNEGRVIRKLLGSIKRLNYPRNFFHALVVADNCTDDTAAVTRSFGIQVAERSATTGGRKTLALSFGAEHLSGDKLTQEGVTVIVDADSRLEADFLKALHFAYQGFDAPVAVQSFRYVANPWNSDTAMLDAAAEALRQWVIAGTRHVWGMDNYALGLGFSFRTRYLKDLLNYFPETLAEDKAWKAWFGDKNLRIGYAPDARLAYEVVSDFKKFTEQRRRWVGSSWEVARRYGWRMFWQGITRPDFSQVDFSFSLFQQPRSFVLIGSLITAIISFVKPSASFLPWWFWIILPVLLVLYGALGLKILNARPVKYLALFRGLPFVWNVARQTVVTWFKASQTWGGTHTSGRMF